MFGALSNKWNYIFSIIYNVAHGIDVSILASIFLFYLLITL